MSATYFTNINPDLLARLPLSARRVLEFGCGEAPLAAEYKLRNPLAHYTAIEIHAPSAAVARGRVDRLLEGDVEQMSDAEIGGPFDLALMGDVLEHLSDPWRALRRMHALLAPGAHFVCCVPNISHWSALAELMTGQWPSRDSGLFDRTHLRFFTLDSLSAILRETGFRSLKVRPRQFLLDEAKAKTWIPKLADAAAALGIDRNAFIGRATALQYVVTTEKPRDTPTAVARISLHAMAPRFMDVRTRLPAEALDAEPGLSVTVHQRDLRLPQVARESPHVAIVQRLGAVTEAQWLGWLADAIANDWAVVAELDDHPDLIAAVHGRADDPGKWLSVRAAHAAQTSTPALADAFRPHNPEVAAFGNAAFRLPPFRPARTGPARVFFGALNREAFSGPIARALTPFLAAHPETEFTVVHDRAFSDGLATDRKQFHAATGYDAYLDLMSGCDIALMPLEGTSPEMFKSDVKFVEASSRSLATIASPPVYGDTIRDGETGLIAAPPDDWPAALGRLVAEPSLRERLARNAWEYVRAERMFAGQVGVRRDWYLSVWARRRELTAALTGRYPALGEMLAARGVALP